MSLNLNTLLLVIILIIVSLIVIASPLMMLLLAFLLIGIYWSVSRAIEYINEQTTAQFAALNHQLKISLRVPEKKPFNLEWKFPHLKGVYLNKHISISMRNENIAGVAVPHTTITIDATHYGKTFEIKSETFWTFFKKRWGKRDVNTGDDEFDRQFYVTSNDHAFMKKMLDEDIRDIMKKEVFLQMGTFSLKESQLQYQEQIAINTDKQRIRFENIILVMYMMTKKMERMR